MTMSNTLIFFLLENSIDINCSVYSLSSGSIKFQDLTNSSWSTNFSEAYLPAYYVTNCSIPNLIDQITDLSQNSTYLKEWEENYKCSPYNESDNGDTLVALLFTISGSCISCLMFSLLFYLSPKHKRKPILTQIATVFYTILTIILLDKITHVASEEYYSDTLDIIHINEKVYSTDFFRGFIVVSQILTQSAWFQIVMKLTKQRFKWYSGFIGGILIAAYTAVNIVYEVKYNFTSSIFEYNDALDNQVTGWRISRVVIKLAFIIWFIASLLYYTISIKSPRKICYCKKLIGLAAFVWFLLILHIVIDILMMSIFRRNWLVRIWMNLIPYLIEICILNLVWEWVYSMRSLEKRFELMGVLGRRISLDDVVSFRLIDDNKNEFKRKKKIEHFKSIPKALFGKKYHSLSTSSTTTFTRRDEPLELKELSSTSNFSMSIPKTNSNTMNRFNDSDINSVGAPDHHDTNTSSSHESYDIEYVDNFDIWNDDDEDNDNLQIPAATQYNHSLQSPHDQQEGTSSQVRAAAPIYNSANQSQPPPPPFVPHPGFSQDDYYPDEK